jgi:hypothetical protein
VGVGPGRSLQGDEGSTLYDFDTTQAIWSNNGEYYQTRRALSSFGMMVRKGVRGADFEDLG